MTPKTPPTDRPLTAGDVPLLREGDLVAPVSDLTDYRGGKLPAGVPVPVLNVSSDGYIRVTDPERGHLSYAFTFVSRPETSAASEGETSWQATIDRIVPVIAPMDAIEASEFCCEHTLLLDRTRIRRELAALASPPVSERERELARRAEDVLEALSMLTVAGKPIAALDTRLRDAINAIVPVIAAQPAGEGK